MASPIVAFTDGSAIRNGRNGGAGFAVVFPDYPASNFAAALPNDGNRTNNRAEYMALIRAFEIAEDLDPGRLRPLECHTDSMLLVNSVKRWMSAWKRNGWLKRDGKPVLNQDLLAMIDTWMQLRKLAIHHVPAHGRGHAEEWKRGYNAMADRLARAAAAGGSQ